MYGNCTTACLYHGQLKMNADQYVADVISISSRHLNNDPPPPLMSSFCWFPMYTHYLVSKFGPVFKKLMNLYSCCAVISWVYFSHRIPVGHIPNSQGTLICNCYRQKLTKPITLNEALQQWVLSNYFPLLLAKKDAIFQTITHTVHCVTWLICTLWAYAVSFLRDVRCQKDSIFHRLMLARRETVIFQRTDTHCPATAPLQNHQYGSVCAQVPGRHEYTDAVALRVTAARLRLVKRCLWKDRGTFALVSSLQSDC